MCPRTEGPSQVTRSADAVCIHVKHLKTFTSRALVRTVVWHIPRGDLWKTRRLLWHNSERPEVGNLYNLIDFAVLIFFLWKMSVHASHNFTHFNVLTPPQHTLYAEEYIYWWSKQRSSLYYLLNPSCPWISWNFVTTLFTPAQKLKQTLGHAGYAVGVCK